jgi:hypothetical protein
MGSQMEAASDWLSQRRLPNVMAVKFIWTEVAKRALFLESAFHFATLEQAITCVTF